jgi:hypothetical protein
VDDAVLLEALAACLAEGERTRGAVDAVAARFEVGRRRVYELALSGRAGGGVGDGGPSSAGLSPEPNALPGDNVEGMPTGDRTL